MPSIGIRPSILELKLSKHASVRQQQRGILTGVTEAVVMFGDFYNAGHGCIAYFLGEQAARRHLSLMRPFGDHVRNVAVVVSSDGVIVTVQRVRRPKRWWKSA